MSKKDSVKIKKKNKKNIVKSSDTEKQDSIKISETDINKSDNTNDRNRTVELLISFIIAIAITIPLMLKLANGVQSACDEIDASDFESYKYVKLEVLDKGVVEADNSRYTSRRTQMSLKVRYDNNDYWVGLYNNDKRKSLYDNTNIGDELTFLVCKYKPEYKGKTVRIDYGMTKKEEKRITDYIDKE